MALDTLVCALEASRCWKSACAQRADLRPAPRRARRLGIRLLPPSAPSLPPPDRQPEEPKATRQGIACAWEGGTREPGVWWGWGPDAQNACPPWPPCLRLGPRWGRPLYADPQGLALEAGGGAPPVPAWAAPSPKLRPEPASTLCSCIPSREAMRGGIQRAWCQLALGPLETSELRSDPQHALRLYLDTSGTHLQPLPSSFQLLGTFGPRDFGSIRRDPGSPAGGLRTRPAPVTSHNNARDGDY